MRSPSRRLFLPISGCFTRPTGRLGEALVMLAALVMMMTLVMRVSPAAASNVAAPTDWGATSETIGDITFQHCERTSYDRTRNVECAYIDVPEDHDDPEGHAISLLVVRLPARDGAGAAAPLVAFAGGPGQSASESFLYLDRIFPDAARQRDFYLIDQRGTGGSNPQHCELDPTEAMQVDPDTEQIRRTTEACLRQFSGNPALYTTSVAIQDFEQVREALAVRQWHLYGVSYGTRVVQHYMRQHPGGIRTAIMDSVIPANEPLGPDIALQSQRALDTFLARCAEDATCSEAFPDLAGGLYTLLSDLAEASREVTYEETGSGSLKDMTFTRAHLVGVLRLALYQSEQLATLPPMLHEAYANNHFTALARTADAMSREVIGTLAIGMHNAVVCTEDVPFFAIDDERLADIEATYMGDLMVNALQTTCGVWPAGRLDEGFHDPVTSDIPTLLLSGELDPITPPEYGDIVHATLSNSRHLVAPGQGHHVSIQGCLPTLVAQFIDDEHTDNLNTDCLQRLQATPLFINFNGPTP